MDHSNNSEDGQISAVSLSVGFAGTQHNTRQGTEGMYKS